MVRGRPIYVDASPLIGLARIDHLDLLRVLAVPARVTKHVWQEVSQDERRPGAKQLIEAKQVGLLLVVAEGDPADYPLLGVGEASVLSAAKVGRGVAILDERKARVLIDLDAQLREAVPYLTTTALLVLAKEMGAISHVRPILDALRRETFYIGAKVYEDALRVADEWPVSLLHRPADYPERQ